MAKIKEIKAWIRFAEGPDTIVLECPVCGNFAVRGANDSWDGVNYDFATNTTKVMTKCYYCESLNEVKTE